MADQLDLIGKYRELASKVVHVADGMDRVAGGGGFDVMGEVERELLREYGLTPDAYLIDVGCGSGRLTKALAEHRGRYLGIDVVPDLLDHARTFGRPDWRFELASGLTIPEQDGAADVVCFFSVLTHMLHEQSYLYLADAKRVVRAGGRIVFSFLEFTIPNHWTVFEATVADATALQHPLNVFIERTAIGAWAQHLGLTVVAMRDGTDALPGFSPLGQSVCVLEKPA